MIRAILSNRPDFEAAGCDISRKALLTSLGRTPGVPVFLADATYLPLASGGLDAVLMFDVLEHLERPAVAVAEAARVLTPGGILHLTVPCEGSGWTLQGILRRMGWRAFERTVGHIQAFDLESLRSMLSRSGIDLTHVRWSGHLLSQVAHCGYVAYLSLPGVSIEDSVEGYLDRFRRGIWRSLLLWAKRGLAIFTYFESRVLRGMPGAIAHLTATKPIAIVGDPSAPRQVDAVISAARQMAPEMAIQGSWKGAGSERPVTVGR